MTIEDAAQAAADRDAELEVWRTGQSWLMKWFEKWGRDLYVRAFRALWMQMQETKEDTREDRDALTGDPLTAAKDTAG